jgi:multidrug efflux pump subunit AcrA (membrane-fusion protein)
MCGCSHQDDDKDQDDNKDQEVITVASHPLLTHLFYAGSVQPLKSIVLASPAEGIVEDMTFHYGDVVKAQQPLFVISSSKFQTDYKNALMQYIKAKTDYANNESSFKENEFLYKNQLISLDAYKAAKTNYFNAQLSFIQAKDALASMLQQLDKQPFNFEELTITDMNKINSVLNQTENTQKIHLSSPASGVILLASKDDSGDLSVKINKGSSVKQGDMLALIGDVSGLTIHISVNEFNVNQLKMGQPVKVTGTAFPQFVLKGQISGIDRQAQSGQNGVPVFAVEITVPQLTAAEQAVIHVGMSAKVEITIKGAPVVTVPIAAVFIKNNKTYVKVQDPNDNQITEVPVKTGQTTEDSVVIESPLKAGDTIVISH